MKIGYARVSTVGQDLDTQISKLKAAGCEKIFKEKQSGKSTDKRTELELALSICREDDMLVVTKLDRLARSMGDLHNIVGRLHDQGASFLATDQAGIDTSNATGKLMFNILGSLAEFERDLINARCAEGREAAMSRGVKFGRRPKLTPAQRENMNQDIEVGELSLQAIADKYDVTRKTVQRYKAGTTR